MKVWTQEELIAAAEKVLELGLDIDPRSVRMRVTIDLQCELTEAVGIIEQYRARSMKTAYSAISAELMAQADQFLERNKESQ